MHERACQTDIQWEVPRSGPKVPTYHRHHVHKIIAPSKNRLSVTSTITIITISPQNLLLSVPCENAFSKSKPVSVSFATPACPDQAILTDMMYGYSGPCHNIPYVGHRVVHKSHAFVSRPAPQVQESLTLIVPILAARPQQSSSSLIAPLARLQTLPTQVPLVFAVYVVLRGYGYYLASFQSHLDWTAAISMAYSQTPQSEVLTADNIAHRATTPFHLELGHHICITTPLGLIIITSAPSECCSISASVGVQVKTDWSRAISVFTKPSSSLAPNCTLATSHASSIKTTHRRTSYLIILAFSSDPIPGNLRRGTPGWLRRVCRTGAPAGPIWCYPWVTKCIRSRYLSTAPPLADHQLKFRLPLHFANQSLVRPVWCHISDIGMVSVLHSRLHLTFGLTSPKHGLGCPPYSSYSRTLEEWHVDKPVGPVSEELTVLGASLANKSQSDNISTAEQDLPVLIASSPALSLGNGAVYSDNSQQQQSPAAGILGMAMYPMIP
ncbi:uncharacterized protein CLUP02_02461 [Colletotrichum lupini]|uniref:Uncharacterized protein n=1 Tax=Colletotrichum lupini TaxID=145971 RepID=A0A9Q8SGX0_9PEZI|nr:uncharacterized protein CLUP02_02461 [Colletotrichum lupini]UQC76995.1 hypothetical protein CLUP02_02461 [Colletotrichum lupini]